MKLIVSFCIMLVFSGTAFCQQWTDEQVRNASTAADDYRLNDAEKEIIRYVNLCRLYPAAFVKNELKDYEGIPGITDNNFAKYKLNLAKELAAMQPLQALKPDDLLYDDAKCYGNEISKNERKPHQRIDCIKRSYAECLYYGSGEGKHIAMQWLIDSGIENVGHRRICLSAGHHKIGVKVNPHYEYGHCSVAEFAP